MGNSEVGHLNLGAGRIVYQDLSKINNAIKAKNIPAGYDSYIEVKPLDFIEFLLACGIKEETIV